DCGWQCVDPHRTGDIFYALLADIVEVVRELVADLVVHSSRDTDPAWLGQRFEARSDIDPIAENVVTLGDYVSKIDADAEPDPPFGGDLRIAVNHPGLHLGRTAHRIDHARKFHQ